MSKPKFFVFALLFLFSLTNVFAQNEQEKNAIEPSYEVVLHVVVASNNPAEKGKLPSSLSGVIGKLKNDYTYSNYSLAATFLERMSASGVIGHTGVLNQLKQENDDKIYFSNWGLSGLKTGKDEKGKDLIQFQTFNFGARVPVVTIMNGNQLVNYENIGLKINKFNLPENTPTIIGSLSTQKTDEFIFLILTVRSV